MSNIKIYNSLKREKQEFKPLHEGNVGIYVCGPTVYDEPHIGHVRSAYVFDVIRRYLEYKNYKVKFVRNVTDVDDKIINKGKQDFKDEDPKEAAKKVSQKYLKSYTKCMDNLGIKAPDEEPKATEYIDKMISFIKALIGEGAAYEAESDVYFDITKAKNYGKLSNQNIETLKTGARISKRENLPAGRQVKRNALDFALWKKAKEDEPSWDSPWGKGRPGWHIECSVMSCDILGDEFDIHGGGLDLIFPHHENEIAQSQSLGKKFARYWIHNGLLTINGQKMSKSLGNFITVEELLEKYSADVMKLFFLQVHYSHPIDFSWNKMEEVKKAYERVYILQKKLKENYGVVDITKVTKQGTGAMLQFKQRFDEAMDDDFNMPKALSVLFDMVNKCNVLIDSEEELKSFMLKYALTIMKEMIDIFGLSFFHEQSSNISDDRVEFKISVRKDLREQKKFKEADMIRKQLERKGIILEDAKGDTTWRRKI